MHADGFPQRNSSDSHCTWQRSSSVPSLQSSAPSQNFDSWMQKPSAQAFSAMEQFL